MTKGRHVGTSFFLPVELASATNVPALLFATIRS